MVKTQIEKAFDNLIALMGSEAGNTLHAILDGAHTPDAKMLSVLNQRIYDNPSILYFIAHGVHNNRWVKPSVEMMAKSCKTTPDLVRNYIRCNGKLYMIYLDEKGFIHAGEEK